MKPLPGTSEAITLGCVCPVVENLYRDPSNKLVKSSCGLHGAGLEKPKWSDDCRHQYDGLGRNAWNKAEVPSFVLRKDKPVKVKVAKEPSSKSVGFCEACGLPLPPRLPGVRGRSSKWHEQCRPSKAEYWRKWNNKRKAKLA